MTIVKFPNKALFEPTSRVYVFGEELLVLLDSMWETLQSKGGLGLAANQVGLSLNAFVMVGPNGERLNLVNPEIMSRSKLYVKIREGCLSAPGDFITVPNRAQWVNVMYFDEKGGTCVKLFKDLHAVVVQHEIEHLEGKAFFENTTLPKNVRKEFQKRWGNK